HFTLFRLCPPPPSPLPPYTTLFRSFRGPPINIHNTLVQYTFRSSKLVSDHALHIVVSSLLQLLFHRIVKERFFRNRSGASTPVRSEEHTSELQSRENLVCRLLLEKK